MTVKGTREEIMAVVKALAPTWPTILIDSLDPGEWHFILNGIDTLVIIEDEKRRWRNDKDLLR